MAIKFKRLEKISKHLRVGKLGHQKFNFGVFNSDNKDDDATFNDFEKSCGTMGCAIGEFPFIFPKNFHFIERGFDKGFPRMHGKKEVNVIGHAAEFLGLDLKQTKHLFLPSGDGVAFDRNNQKPKQYGGRRLTKTVTKEAVADNIDAFIAKMRPSRGR